MRHTSVFRVVRDHVTVGCIEGRIEDLLCTAKNAADILRSLATKRALNKLASHTKH